MATVDELVDRIESLTAQVEQYEDSHGRVVEMINELNNLLAAMKGHAQLARMEPTEQKAEELVDVILTTVSRAQHVIREVTRAHIEESDSDNDGLVVHDPQHFTILVVDDEELIRTLLVELLMRVGYQVKSASSGADAIASCKENAFDLILMDFRLGDMNGVAALRQIREFMPVTRVVFLTGDPNIEEIQATVQIPVMAKCRIGHIAEAKMLEALEVDFIDESEVLTPADDENHINKHPYAVPFVCGCRNLGEALRRIGEGAAMMRTKGEAGSGDIVEGVRHMRAVQRGIRVLGVLDENELMAHAKELQAPFELVCWVAENARLPVPNFAAGGIATPADAALVMMLGAEAAFVGSGIFKADDPEVRAKAIVEAVTHWNDPARLLEISRGLGTPMSGIDSGKLTPDEMLSRRGW